MEFQISCGVESRSADIQVLKMRVLRKDFSEQLCPKRVFPKKINNRFRFNENTTSNQLVVVRASFWEVKK